MADLWAKYWYTEPITTSARLAISVIAIASAGFMRLLGPTADLELLVSNAGDLKAHDHRNLRGTMNYVDSSRLANCVEVATYRRTLAVLREQFGRPDPSHQLYELLRINTRAATA